MEMFEFSKWESCCLYTLEMGMVKTSGLSTSGGQRLTLKYVLDYHKVDGYIIMNILIILFLKEGGTSLFIVLCLSS